MANQFKSVEGDLESIYVSDYSLIDQKALTGSLFAWGKNLSGQLGDATIVNKSSPILIQSGITTWKSVAVGYNHTTAIRAEGTVYNNLFGVSSTLYTWGANTSAQLANNTITDTSGVARYEAGTNWKLTSASEYHSAAIKTDGTLWLWGRNANGQHGTGNTTATSAPGGVQCPGTNWKLVTCGRYHTNAIKTDGTIWSWGRNNEGQLGNGLGGSGNDKSSPVQEVTASTSWKTVATRHNHVAAIKTDGTLWMWGTAGNGQLGSSLSAASSPIQTIASGSNWKHVALGQRHSAAIKTDGTLWLWGNGNYGLLGDNTVNLDKSSPIQTIAGGNNWKQLSCGRFHISAIKTDGTLWTWGRNQEGQLGDTSVTNRSSPVQTTKGGTNWKMVSAGGYHTVGLHFYEAGNLYPNTI